jgi:hypothetical protein
MGIFDTFNLYKECTDTKRAFILLSMIEEQVKAEKDNLKSELESDDLGCTVFDDLGKSLNVIEIQKSTLDQEKVKAGLTDEEIRSVYKATDKDLTTLKRKDLKEFKSVEVVRQIRVTTIKVENKEIA